MQSKDPFLITDISAGSRRPHLIFLVLILLTFLSPDSVMASGRLNTSFPLLEVGQYTTLTRCIGVDDKGRWLVAALDDKTARVLSLDTGDLVWMLRPPNGKNQETRIYAVDISPDGEMVAVGGWAGYAREKRNSIHIFSRPTGAFARRVEGLPDNIFHLAFSPDGKRLAAALGAKGIRVYRTDTWEEIGRDTNYGSASHRVAFDRNGRLASTCYDGFIRLYDRNFKLLAREKARGGERPFGVAFSPDGKRIAVGFVDIGAVDVLSGLDLRFIFAPHTPVQSKEMWLPSPGRGMGGP